MKKIFVVFVLAISVFSSCRDVLDQENLSGINADIWNSEVSANLFLNKIYAEGLPSAAFGGNADRTDEAIGTPSIMYGELATGSEGTMNGTIYTTIRRANLAISEMQKSTLSDDAKKRIVGQAKFLRAWKYFEMVRLYGGVPLSLTALNPDVDDLNISRSTTKATIDQIVSDLDYAIEGLPAKWTETSKDYGRITRGAAAALKGRVLLMWASPQFNNYDRGTDEYTARWTTAYNACKEAKTICTNDGYGLYSSFDNLFINEGNIEDIFVRVYDRTYSKVHTWENSIRPRPYGIDGGQSSNPTYELAMAYPMKSGLPATVENGFNTTYFWKDRDPRFYATIAYNGSRWSYLTASATDTVWTYLNNNWESVASLSGYYCRKASNPAIPKEQAKECGTDWVEIRYAEVLLNLAECANALGKQSEAYDELIAIRKRAGILPGTDGYCGLTQNMSFEPMLATILKERLLEFAFENKRYWDLRRYKLYTHDYAGIPKMNQTQRHAARIITRIAAATVNANRGKYDLQNTYGTYFRDVTSFAKESESKMINYLEKYYFFDIQQSFLDRCPAVKQTKGWGVADSLSFDPLAE